MGGSGSRPLMRLQPRRCQGLQAGEMPHSLGCWLKASVSGWLLEISIGLLECYCDMASSFSKKWPKKKSKEVIPKKEEGKNCKAFYNLVLGAPRLPLSRALLEVSYLVLAAPRDREMGAWLRLLKGGVSKDLWPLEKNLVSWSRTTWKFIYCTFYCLLYGYLHYSQSFAVICVICHVIMENLWIYIASHMYKYIYELNFYKWNSKLWV